MNRDEEVVMLEDGRFMRQRKVYERKQPPAEPTILDFNDDPPELRNYSSDIDCEHSFVIEVFNNGCVKI